MSRFSGLQRDVMRLYKRSLKLVASKPVETRPNWYQFVAHQFRSPALGGGIRRRDTATIEYMIRRWKKMLDQYEHHGVRDVAAQGDDQRWPEGWIAKGGKDKSR